MFEKVKEMGHLGDSVILSTIITYMAYVIGAVGTFMAAFMAWFFKREVAKLDDLQKNTIKRPEFERLRNDVHEFKKEVLTHFDKEHEETRGFVKEILVLLRPEK